MKRDGLGALVLNVEIQVVLHILADGWQVVGHRNADLLQVVSVADAGKHQKLRRVDRAAGKNDLEHINASQCQIHSLHSNHNTT